MEVVWSRSTQLDILIFTSNQNLGKQKYATSNLSVVATGGNIHAIWRVTDATHCVEVSLLLEDVGLALPLPDDELTELRAADGDPLARLVERHRVDTAVRNADDKHAHYKHV